MFSGLYAKPDGLTVRFAFLLRAPGPGDCRLRVAGGTAAVAGGAAVALEEFECEEERTHCELGYHCNGGNDCVGHKVFFNHRARFLVRWPDASWGVSEFRGRVSMCHDGESAATVVEGGGLELEERTATGATNKFRARSRCAREGT